jgi:hypothetical protein
MMSPLSNLQLSPQGFLFDHSTGTSYTTNRVGVFILRRLMQGDSRVDILENLVAEYDVSRSRADQDLTEFAELMRNYRLLRPQLLEKSA